MLCCRPRLRLRITTETSVQHCREACLLPIPAQMSYLASIGGDDTPNFAARIFSALFGDEVTLFLTFYGKKPGFRALYGSPIYDVILDVFNRWNVDKKSDWWKLEEAFKNAFKKAHDRQQRRSHKAPSSQPTNVKPTSPTNHG
nr:unnamed protein product [Spirometra erinaceieuropaei]